MGDDRNEKYHPGPDGPMQVPTPWTDTLVLVCQKCDPQNAETLQAELKAGTKEKFGKGAVRVSKSQCLDVCPIEGVTVGIFGEGDPAAVLVVDPIRDTQAVVAALEHQRSM